jgi:hypothetical protein
VLDAGLADHPGEPRVPRSEQHQRQEELAGAERAQATQQGSEPAGRAAIHRAGDPYGYAPVAITAQRHRRFAAGRAAQSELALDPVARPVPPAGVVVGSGSGSGSGYSGLRARCCTPTPRVRSPRSVSGYANACPAAHVQDTLDAVGRVPMRSGALVD